MLRKILNSFRPNKFATDLREELEFHRSQTSGQLGNLMLLQDRMRDASTVVWLETALNDIRYGFRQLRKAPVLVSVAVLSLALGIGANTAIFTILKAIMLQFLPVKDPARLVLFYDGMATGTFDGDSPQSDEFSYSFYEHLKAHNDSFEDLCAFRQSNDTVLLHVSREDSSGSWERAKVHLVSGNYFGLLGVGASVGRLLRPADDAPGSPGTAVLSYPFWRDRFHLDPAVVGQTVILNRAAFTIVGVGASEFFGERIQPAPDFWIPLSFQPQILQSPSYFTAPDVYWLNFFGRLKPGVSRTHAEAAVNIGLHQFYLQRAGTHPSANMRRKIESVHVDLKPGGGGISALRFLYSQPLKLLMAVVAVVLLIACANVATLLLARAFARGPEFLTRLALGASPGRLFRQVLTESILLSMIGGLTGLGFAWWGIKGLALLLHISPVVKITPDLVVLAFTFALCVVTGILFGIFPALKFSRMDPRPGNATRPALLAKWRITSGKLLVTLQVSLSLVLLFGGSLLAHSLVELERQNLGFQRDNILVISSDASFADYKQAELAQLYRDLGDRFSHLPGVISAGIARFTPESGHSSAGNFSIEGYNAPTGLKLDVYRLPVAPGFFETIGIPLLLGRTISVRDTPGSPAVAVVNQTFVKTYFPHHNPLGQRMMLGAPFKAPGAEIVGVVADSRFYGLGEKAPPMVFFSFWQNPTSDFHAVLRTTAAALSLVPEVRRTFKEVNARLPILETTTLNAQIENSLRQQKMITTLCGAFGLLALALTLVGIYGTTAYSVAGRTNEIGIRMAIGAQRRTVIWLILREEMLLIAGGVVLGIPLALAGTHLLKSFLFGVQALDPLAISAALLLIAGLAMVAGFIPAQTAANVDPIRALRQE